MCDVLWKDYPATFRIILHCLLIIPAGRVLMDNEETDPGFKPTWVILTSGQGLKDLTQKLQVSVKCPVETETNEMMVL